MPTTKMTTQFKKARVRCEYEVYETQAGGVFTARLLSYNRLPTPEATWSEPADTAIEACKKAYAEWRAANFVEKEKPIYGFGSH
jgi:hypothetical protein